MTYNNTLVTGGSNLSGIVYRITIVQVLVVIFLSVNFLQLTTIFKKDFFYRTMRYILFANTLIADCMTLLVSNLLVILLNFQVTMQVWLCLMFYFELSLHNFITPVTLTAMTLERYVAICMPLRHAELCSTRRALHSILIIHALSSIPFIVIISALFSSVTVRFSIEYVLCSVEVTAFYNWQRYLRSVICQFYFLIMCIIIVFCYVKITKVAKAASGESKKSTSKGLRTVVLHAFQLLLCLINLLCPLIESALYQIDFMLLHHVRYINFIIFGLAPRCLSPLIYGLRDEKFVHELKYNAFCGLHRKRSVLKQKIIVG